MQPGLIFRLTINQLELYHRSYYSDGSCKLIPLALSQSVGTKWKSTSSVKNITTTEPQPFSSRPTGQPTWTNHKTCDNSGSWLQVLIWEAVTGDAWSNNKTVSVGMAILDWCPEDQHILLGRQNQYPTLQPEACAGMALCSANRFIVPN